MKIKTVFFTGLAALAILSCPVGDDDPNVGKWATVVFDTGDINPLTGAAAGQGIPPTTSIQAIVGDTMNRFPEPLWRDGNTLYEFVGWYTDIDSEFGEYVGAPYKVPGDVTLYAYWGNFSALFDATNNGADPDFTVNGYSSIQRFARRPPWSFPSLPVPVNEDNAFLGWYFKNASNADVALTRLTNIATIPLSNGVRRVYPKWGIGPQDFTAIFRTMG
jgi:uncharacterized repeat protein (TIGR02543 family)